MKKAILPNEIPVGQLHQLLVSTVAPRPIAFVSTVDKDGVENLAPYSFFNVFSSNPPTMVFSSNRKVSDNETKDTLHNVQATKEAVINIVSYDIVRQMSVASSPFDSGISEFEKTGLTAVASDLVKAPRVKEAPVNFECIVKDIITLGDEGGAGHLVICEVVKIHVSEHIFDKEGRVVPEQLDVVARMGRAYYSRAKEGIFKIFQPMTKPSIGYDQLPDVAKNSDILTGNDLGEMAGLLDFPSQEMVLSMASDEYVNAAQKVENSLEEVEKYAQSLIKKGAFEKALAVLMYVDKG